jgi:hypothetical protein
LIDLLPIDPADVGGLVALARICGENGKDYAPGERFARRAVEVAPRDTWALKSLGAMLLHTGGVEEGVPLIIPGGYRRQFRTCGPVRFLGIHLLDLDLASPRFPR